MDDPGIRKTLLASMKEHGLSGIFHHMANMAVGDKAWGLFRPAYWVYASTFYLLSPKAAYGLRLIFFIVIMMGPLYLIDSHLKSFKYKNLFLWLTGFVLLANGPLYSGLSFVSLQEFTGCFVISLALFAFSGNPASILIPIFFIIAALLKAPFVWMVLLLGISLIFQKRYLQGGLTFIAGSLSLAVISSWVKQGLYTQRFEINLDLILTSLKGALLPFGLVGLCLLLMLVIWQKNISIKNPKATALEPFCQLGLVLFFSGLLYFGNLLPWGAVGYYYGAPLYMITVGSCMVLASFLKTDNQLNQIFKPLTAFIVLAGILVCGRGFYKTLYRDFTIRQITQWAQKLPNENLRIGINMSEGAKRLEDLMEIRTQNQWQNKMVYSLNPDKDQLDYYILVKEGGIFPVSAPLIASMGDAQLHKY